MEEMMLMMKEAIREEFKELKEGLKEVKELKEGLKEVKEGFKNLDDRITKMEIALPVASSSKLYKNFIYFFY